MAKTPKKETRPAGWLDATPLGGAARIMDLVDPLKKATPKPPKPRKKPPGAL